MLILLTFNERFDVFLCLQYKHDKSCMLHWAEALVHWLKQPVWKVGDRGLDP